MFLEAIGAGLRHKIKPVLKDLNFDIRRGEVVGIIGKNGAGKSTLLKILAGTLDKSSGQIEINGKVSAILELGTGFHPDYTGRENIILGGMCLGMTKAEALERQESIIEFSELRHAIDDPLRTYSSGMQARLTFSTAISVTPDIFIVDEALATGDAAFVEKCLGRMDDIARSGATVLLVTHNTNLIPRFGNRAIWIESGQIVADGDAIAVSKQYEVKTFLKVRTYDHSSDDAIGDQKIRIAKTEVYGTKIDEGVFLQGTPLIIEVELHSSISSKTAELIVHICREDGIVVWSATTYEYMTDQYKLEEWPLNIVPGCHTITLNIPNVLLNTGRYLVNVGVEPKQDTARIADYHDWQRYAATFSITRESALVVGKYFDSPSSWSIKKVSTMNAAETEEIKLLPYPAPYASAISISNDCEFLTRDAALGLLAELSDPDKYGLEITTSMFFYTTNAICHSSIGYFDGLTQTPSVNAPLLRDLCQSGWIDTLHSYGDFDAGGFTRKLAEIAVNEFCKYGLTLPVYTNHGSNKNFQNVGHASLANYQGGDDPSSEAYHIDLTKKLGAKYFWTDDMLSSTPDISQNLFKEATCRDGQKILLFNRYRGLFGCPAPTMESLSSQILESDLRQIAMSSGVAIFYQHLGVASRDSAGTFTALSHPYIPPSADSVFKYLSRLQREKLCLVAGTGRLLSYIQMRDSIKINLEEDILTINTSMPWSSKESFDGLSIQLHNSVVVRKTIFASGNRSIELPMVRLSSQQGTHYILMRPWPSLDRSVFT